MIIDTAFIEVFLNVINFILDQYYNYCKIIFDTPSENSDLNNSANRNFDWTPFASAALGGAAAIAASIIAFKLSNRAERKNKERDEKRIFAMHAVSGYSKLIQIVNLISNIKLHIDNSFMAAEEAGIEATEPYQSVAPSAGKFLEPEKLKVEEFIFLLELSATTVSDINLIENRAINYLDLLNRYSSIRLDMMAWQSSIPELIREVDGPKAIDAFPIKYRDQHNSKAAQLNLLLWGIIEHLDEDEKFARNTLKSYVDHARSHYGTFFPKIEIVYEEPKSSYPFDHKKYFK